MCWEWQGGKRVFWTYRKAWAIALLQEGTGYVCGKDKLIQLQYTGQGAWCEMKVVAEPDVQSLTPRVKDYSLSPKSNGKFEAGYSSMRH